MKEVRLNGKIRYDNFDVLNVKVLNNIIFVKALNCETLEVVWFLGFKSKQDILSDIKRVVIEKHMFTNKFFRTMFKDDTLPTNNPIIFNETSNYKTRRKNVV